MLLAQFDRRKMLPLLLENETRDGHASAILATHAACLKSSSKVNRPTTEAYFRKVQRLTARAIVELSALKNVLRGAMRYLPLRQCQTMSENVGLRRGMTEQVKAALLECRECQTMLIRLNEPRQLPATGCSSLVSLNRMSIV